MYDSRCPITIINYPQLNYKRKDNRDISCWISYAIIDDNQPFSSEVVVTE